MHGSERHVVVRLPSVFGVDFSITNEVLLLWAAAAVTFLLLTTAFRRRGLVAKGPYRNFFEGLAQIIENEAVRGGMGAGGEKWAPFLLALFFFILFGNLLGLVPLPPYFRPATSNISVTAALALTVFGLMMVFGLKRNGFRGFAAKFLPEGVPAWAGIIVVPVEIISLVAKPFSLAIRLFVNMLTGHLLIVVFVGLTAAAAFYLKPLPLLGAVVMSGFEIFVCFIQAFIFTLLAAIYINESLQSAHTGTDLKTAPNGGKKE